VLPTQHHLSPRLPPPTPLNLDTSAPQVPFRLASSPATEDPLITYSRRLELSRQQLTQHLASRAFAQDHSLPGSHFTVFWTIQDTLRTFAAFFCLRFLLSTMDLPVIHLPLLLTPAIPCHLALAVAHMETTVFAYLYITLAWQRRASQHTSRSPSRCNHRPLFSPFRSRAIIPSLS